jgi:hypothetical protein
MDNRYSLRFETGERAGETVPITGSGFTIGRKPGNSLQILDNSVSGQHAEIEVDAEGARVKDRGSTNGTRVAEQRVVETRLAHGDVVTFGNVRVTFLDARIGASPGSSLPAVPTGSAAPAHSAAPSPAVAAPTVLTQTTATRTVFVAPAEGLLRVSADVLARSSKRSRLGGVIVLLLAVGGGAVWYFLNHSSHGSGVQLRPVERVAGDLLDDEYSFEGEHDGWSAAEGSPAAFLKSERARYSGSFGMACDLAANEWALHRSKEVRCDPDRELEARAMLRPSAGVEMRLGIEFSAPSTGDAPAPAPVTAWGAAATGGSGFESSSTRALVPPGYSSARVCVLARARGGAQDAQDRGEGGGAAFDDASLLMRPAASKPAAQVNEHRLYLYGDPPAGALLFKVDRVLISNVEARGKGDEARSPLAATADGSKITLSLGAELPADGGWRLRAEAPLARARIATIASGAYRTHGAAFERDSVQTLLLGTGNDLVALKFAAPVRISGVTSDSASQITIAAGGQKSFDLQLDFKAEKTEAGNRAYAARNAEKKGDLGQCLKEWSALLDSYPYEETLVAEAESTRGRLIQKGLEELRLLRAEIERARFFRLVDLYRQCRDKALAVGARYASSEVETEAKNVAAEVDVDLAGLEANLAKDERARLSSIMNALDAQKAIGLAGEVRAYLGEMASRNAAKPSDKPIEKPADETEKSGDKSGEKN